MCQSPVSSVSAAATLWMVQTARVTVGNWGEFADALDCEIELGDRRYSVFTEPEPRHGLLRWRSNRLRRRPLCGVGRLPKVRATAAWR